MGHGGWTALAGLGIGLAFLFRRWWYVSWIPMVGAFGLATWDHMMVNYGGAFSDVLDLLLLSGNLPILVFLVGLFATVGVDLAVLFRTGRKHGRFPPLRLTGRLAILDGASFADVVLRAQTARDYSRSRRGALYALWIAGDDPPRGVAGMAHGLESMAGILVVDLPEPADGADAGREESDSRRPPRAPEEAQRTADDHQSDGAGTADDRDGTA